MKDKIYLERITLNEDDNSHKRQFRINCDSAINCVESFRYLVKIAQVNKNENA